MKNIRIGSGAGYAGDRVEPALDIIENGQVDYVIFECLAERTIALAQSEKLNNPSKGYNNLLEYRFERILPLLRNRSTKIITNMGAANPVAAAEKVHELAMEKGLEMIKIVAVEGDDILSKIDKYMDKTIIETGVKLAEIKEKIISANAYIGAKVITEALEAGADIVITGRIADPALVTGPMMYEFNKNYEDYSFLGKTIVAGHLIECASQVVGGYFADPGYKEVPDLYNVGFPIIDISANGSFTIEKLENAGGLINKATVKEQLLYEIQDPANYYTPDVIADFTDVSIDVCGTNKVQITGAIGKEKTGQLKVSIGYLDGYKVEAEISYGGNNCITRARLAESIIRQRMEAFGVGAEDIRCDYIGVNSLYHLELDEEIEAKEVRLRFAMKAEDKNLVESLSMEVEALYLNGPAGGGGVRSNISRIISIASILIDEEVDTSYTFIGGVRNEII